MPAQGVCCLTVGENIETVHAQLKGGFVQIHHSQEPGDCFAIVDDQWVQDGRKLLRIPACGDIDTRPQEVVKLGPF